MFLCNLFADSEAIVYTLHALLVPAATAPSASDSHGTTLSTDDCYLAPIAPLVYVVVLVSLVPTEESGIGTGVVRQDTRHLALFPQLNPFHSRSSQFPSHNSTQLLIIHIFADDRLHLVFCDPNGTDSVYHTHETVFVPFTSSKSASSSVDCENGWDQIPEFPKTDGDSEVFTAREELFPAADISSSVNPSLHSKTTLRFRSCSFSCNSFALVSSSIS